MTLRLFGKSDDILRMLLPELGFGFLAVQTRRHSKRNPQLSTALIYVAIHSHFLNRLEWFWNLAQLHSGHTHTQKSHKLNKVHKPRKARSETLPNTEA